MKTFMQYLNLIKYVIGLMIILTTTLGAYYRSNSEIRAQIADSRLEIEQDFARKDEIKEVNDKLDSIQADLGEIKGYIKWDHQRRGE